MKQKITTLFLSVCIWSALFSQNTFLKVYKFYGDAAKMFPADLNIAGAAYSDFYPDRFFLLAYESATDINGGYPGKEVLSLITLDTLGNILKKNDYYVGTALAQDNGITIDNNGDILIGARRYSTSGSYNDGLYLRLDTSGNILSSKIYGSWDSGSSGDDDGIKCIKSLPTGNGAEELYVAGGMSIAANLNTCQNAFIEKIDKNSGLVKWHHEVDIPYCTSAEDVFLYPNNQDLALYVKNAYPYLLALITIDTAGNSVNMPVGYAFDNSTTYYPMDVTCLFTTSNYHFVSGLGGGDDSSLFAFMTDLNHNVLWKKKYNFDARFYAGKGTAIEASDNYLYMAAYAKNGQTKGGLVFMKIDPNDGSVVWHRYMGANVPGTSEALFYPHKIMEINNSFYIIGQRLQYIYVLKCDKNGNWGDDCNDNIPLTMTEENLPFNIVVSNIVSNSDVTYGIGNVTLPDSLILYDEISYGGPPALNVYATPNPVCRYTTVNIIDSSSNVNSWKTKIYDSFWYPEGQDVSYYSSNDYENDSIWYYGGDNVSSSNYFDKDASYCYDSALIIVNVTPYPFTSGFLYSTNQLTVQFTDTTTSAVQWLWDFGDGTTSTQQNPVHSYASPGNYTVCLTAWSPCDSITSCQTINPGSATDVQNLLNPQIQIYPNPAEGNIFISGYGEQASLMVKSIDGKIIMTKNIFSNQQEVDISSLSKGTYFFEITIYGQQTNHLVIKK